MLVGLKREKVGALCILWLKELSTFGAEILWQTVLYEFVVLFE